MKQKSLTVTAEYLPLHKYLDERFATTVVLTLAEIEDLCGVKLPEVARLEPEWWANLAADGTSSVQSRSWLQASRTAKANLSARIVTFERTA